MQGRYGFMIECDIHEWRFPRSVLDVLLKDRSTGRNLIWGTDDYANRGEGFGVCDEMRLDQIVDRGAPVIRPRVYKAADEQRRRSVNRAEVFTPSWICNLQNNLVDASWFDWEKPNSSPFNTELKDFDHQTELGWRSTCGKTRIAFPRGKTWMDYVRAPRMEITCGEAPYLASRYDAVTGRMIPVDDRIGLLDRKLRVITERVGLDDVQDWLYHAKRAVQSIYGFDWQGDNVFLARENVMATVIESFNADFFGEENSYADNWSERTLLEFAEIVSWNIWQMDGLKLVVPMSCRPVKKTERFLDGTEKTTVGECPGCRKKGYDNHTGIYCKIRNWQTGAEFEFRNILRRKGGAK